MFIVDNVPPTHLISPTSPNKFKVDFSCFIKFWFARWYRYHFRFTFCIWLTRKLKKNWVKSNNSFTNWTDLHRLFYLIFAHCRFDKCLHCWKFFCEFDSTRCSGFQMCDNENRAVWNLWLPDMPCSTLPTISMWHWRLPVHKSPRQTIFIGLVLSSFSFQS